MADNERKPRRLQVATMRPDDSGRGIARLPRAMMKELGLAEGDVIELRDGLGRAVRLIVRRHRIEESDGGADA